MVLRPLPSASYLVYNASNSGPQLSARPGHSFGHMSVQSPFSSTRFMNKSGVHKA